MSGLKSFIPHFIKYPLWWLFKSPQRNLGIPTISRDLRGVFSFCFYSIFKTKKLVRVSICTGLYNRSELYLQQLVHSAAKARHSHLIELSVFDCGSDDLSDLEQRIAGKWKGDLVFSSEKQKFTRAVAFNNAVAQCSADIIFICDSDMSVPKNIVSLCNHFTSHNTVWYPIVFYLDKGKPAIENAANGHWMQYGGKGMLACRKQDFIKVGKLNEQFTEWGREDDDLWERFIRAGYSVIRNRQRGLIHHWHPSFNPKYQIAN